jgi:hypothetical protein
MPVAINIARKALSLRLRRGMKIRAATAGKDHSQPG